MAVPQKIEQPEKTGYHNLKEDSKHEDWKKLSADYAGEGGEEELRIDGHPVMEAWEQPYMASLAKVATRNGGRVLEVGFGLGLSATAIQGNKLEEHIIIEANEGVVQRGKKWAEDQPNKVTFVHGLWQEAIDKVPDNSLDGILYDTYPLNKEEQHTHQFDFIRQAFPKLKKGGILTYCNLTSIGVLYGEHKEWKKMWEETQVPHLKNIGFEKMDFENAPTNPPKKCEYYQWPEGLVPVCYK